MRHTVPALTLGAFMATLAGCATAPPTIQAPPGAPVAEAPTRNVGDEWTYLQTGQGVRHATKVVGIEGDLLVITRSDRPPEYRAYLNRNLTVVKAAGGEASVGWRFLDFPLFAGKSWSYTSEAQNPRTRAWYSYNNVATVLAHEEIAVPAGKFQAFKIRHQSSTPYWLGETVYWYASAVKAIVKIQDVSQNFWTSPTDTELISFSLK